MDRGLATNFASDRDRNEFLMVIGTITAAPTIIENVTDKVGDTEPPIEISFEFYRSYLQSELLYSTHRSHILFLHAGPVPFLIHNNVK